MPPFSDIHYSILSLLAQCGYVSRATFDLLPYSYNYMITSVKTLVDKNAIRKSGRGRQKHYALNLSGRKLLSSYNPLRFSPDVMEQNRQLSRHPDRAMLRGDIAALLSLAGYGVHPHDKPPLPASTPPLPTSPEHQHLVTLCRNSIQHAYPDVEDERTYNRRLTAIGSYYDITAIKALFPKEESYDNEGINYARACGLLMTPDNLLRVYHSRDVALKVHKIGEDKLKLRMTNNRVYQGFLPADRDGILVFGADFTSSISIIQSSLDGLGTRLVYSRGKAENVGQRNVPEGVRLTPVNLGNPSYYLPLDRNGMAMASLYQYPGWNELLVGEINRQAFQINSTSNSYELEGRRVHILAALNMAEIETAFHMMRMSAASISIVCLDWQYPLFCELAEPLKDRDILIVRMPSGFVEEITGKLDNFWR